MNFVKKDIDSLPRREYFRHYMDDVRCTYSMTINVDITGLYKRTKEKQLRLYEAQRLMLSENFDASNAAYAVGYESASQFNREYKRMFGLPPATDIRQMKS